MYVRFVPSLLLPNLPHHPLDIAQQPPNLPDERAQVVINHYLHHIDIFLAVTSASVPIFFLFARTIPWLASIIE